MIPLTGRLRDKKRRIAVGMHTYALAKKLNCDTETFIMATKEAMALHNSIQGTVQRSKDSTQLLENIIHWAETHIELIRAQISRQGNASQASE